MSLLINLSNVLFKINNQNYESGINMFFLTDCSFYTLLF